MPPGCSMYRGSIECVRCSPATVGRPRHDRAGPASCPQMDRFIPNRSASNLEMASFGAESENFSTASPAKVGL